MKNVIFLGWFLLLLASCNSNAKKDNHVAQKQDSSELKASIQRGKTVYNDMCITCHLPNGKGVPKAFPPLADSDYLRENQKQSIKAVKYGMSGEITVNGITYNSTMSPLGLSNEEVADVVNYINNSWGNTIDHFVTPEKVSEL
ncbi:c-type cytochrome [Winogradskyella sediminis]|uniref:Cytochrome c553 n=1 Tax=Winogradskyella sediminis TaxID=1382466 RepID=A0A1H1VQN2_9FLAO|nr:cytochrome c [Winogradskyella sediminis]REG87786.1 cytochrome c553 [Winogradskyella sediminis]SDS86596.1 Cytochrome c553 [Winogradskyella sediminis]